MTHHQYLEHIIKEEKRTVRIIDNHRAGHQIQLVLDNLGSIDLQMLDLFDHTVIANMRLYLPDEAMLVAEQLIALSVEPATIDSIAPPQWLADLKVRCQKSLSQQFIKPEADEPDEDDSEDSTILAK